MVDDINITDTAGTFSIWNECRIHSDLFAYWESDCTLHVLCSHMAEHDSSEYSGDRSHHLAKKLFKNEIH